jgi:hypothetical protein
MFGIPSEQVNRSDQRVVEAMEEMRHHHHHLHVPSRDQTYAARHKERHLHIEVFALTCPRLKSPSFCEISFSMP